MATMVGRYAVGLVADAGNVISGTQQAQKALHDYDRAAKHIEHSSAAKTTLPGGGIQAQFAGLGQNIAGIKGQLSEFAGAVKGAAAVGIGQAIFDKAKEQAKEFIHFVNEGINSLATLAKMRINFGLSMEGIDLAQAAMARFGLSAEDMEGSLRYLGKHISEASMTGSEAALNFRMWGLDAQRLIGLPLDKALTQIAERFREIRNPAEQMEFAFDVLGRRGMALLPVLRQGAEGMARLQEMGRVFGGEKSDEELRSVLALSKAISETKAAWSLFWDSLKESAAAGFAAGIGKAWEGLNATLANSKPIMDSIRETFHTIGETAGQWVKWGIENIPKMATEAWNVLKPFLEFAKLVYEIDKAWRNFWLGFFDDIGVFKFFRSLGSAIKEVVDVAQAEFQRLRQSLETIGIVRPAQNLGDAGRNFVGGRGFGGGDWSDEGFAAGQATINADRAAIKALADLEKERANLTARLGVAQLPHIATADLDREARLWAERESNARQGASSPRLAELDRGAATERILQTQIRITMELRRQADTIREQIKSPLENFTSEITRIDEALSRGFLQRREAALGMLSIVERLERTAGATELRLPQAVLAGSSDAVSAINRFRTQGDDSPAARLERIRAILGEMHRQQGAQNRIAEAMADDIAALARAARGSMD